MTAAVASADPGAGTPTGSVAFSDRTTMLATVPLNNGQATFSTTKFQPGDHAITATYSGDPVFTASTTGAPAIATVGFSRPCITDHDGPLTVAADQSLCIAPDGRQNGPVELRPGGAPALSALVPEFEGNRVGAPLHCAGNLPTLRKSGNTLNGPHIGQCK
ncbi:Ig-like domain-containing protein [Streptomyces violascens]|uniref:Ig-like domain-containing protein n=1 Tax=Streptomyces violascens TaxID=67381 RepID=UPI0036A49592